MKLTFANPILPIGEIKITEEFSKSPPRLEKLKKCMDFYRANDRFDRQIIVDNDKSLHDGYCAYLTAYLLGVETVKVLMVEEQAKPIKSIPNAKEEPMKLYGAKNFSCLVTKGKLYEFVNGNISLDGGLRADRAYSDYPHFVKGNPRISACLVPLVQRPAEDGESVYISAPTASYGAYSLGEVVRAEETDDCGGIYFCSASGRTNKNSASDRGLCFALPTEYLVLDGYKGDAE